MNKEYHQRWRDGHRESVRDATRRYQDANREKCRAATRRWRAEHKEEIAARNQAVRERSRRIIAEAKSVPCRECGCSYPSYVMDLHHRDPAEKRFTIGKTPYVSEQRLRDEIAKCDVFCANCHRELHNSQEAQ